MSTNPLLHHARRIAQITTNGRAVNDRGIQPASAVIDSWHRCLDDYAMDPTASRSPAVLDGAVLREHQERLEYLLKIAQVEMKDLYEQIAGSGFAIIFTDAEGVIINYVCDAALDRDFRGAGLWLGASWSEQHEGTNGIGTCIVEKQPVTIHRDEHFRSRHIGLTCSASPICDSHGNLMAVLDASSVNCRDTKQSQFHTQVLVKMSARLIENCNFLREYRDTPVLRFHSRAEYVGLLNEAMLAIAEDGTVLAANVSALTLLECVRRDALEGKSIGDLLDLTPAMLHERSRAAHAGLWPVRDLHRGRRYYAMLHLPRRRASARPPESAPHGARPLSLSQLAGSDARMAYNLRAARRVLDHSISILLMGETGTGKEVFARALHQASRRAEHPFVAVNCSAIPENLIESELFGYRHGAFTGARREGMKGKVLQADGGTLFLDEIGDMPAHLQTRLLRMLEEGEILPLGCEKPVPVELHVISATHRDLEALVAQGKFREDLYYRLNGIALTLPAVREREDRAELIRAIFELENRHGRKISLHPAAMETLLACDWPGNIRQLKNVLRTALALADGGIVRAIDLPREIIVPRASRSAPPMRETIIDAPNDAGKPLLAAEREALLMALAGNCWHIGNTAASLGVSRNALYRKLKKHGLPSSKPG